MTDLEAVAASLADTTANISALIDNRALELAQPHISMAQFRAREQVRELEEMASAERQRSNDLVKELRRQLDARIKSGERLQREDRRIRAALRRVEALHVWKNEDDKRFVFADELFEAIKIEEAE